MTRPGTNTKGNGNSNYNKNGDSDNSKNNVDEKKSDDNDEEKGDWTFKLHSLLKNIDCKSTKPMVDKDKKRDELKQVASEMFQFWQKVAFIISFNLQIFVFVACFLYFSMDVAIV